MRRLTGSLCIALSLAIHGVGNTATAAPTTNLVVNGSFEGSNGLTGWSIGGSVGDGAPPVAIAYDQSSLYPTGAQNEIVPADDTVSASPDAAGNTAIPSVVSEPSTCMLIFGGLAMLVGAGRRTSGKWRR